MKKNFYGKGNDAFICEQCGTKVYPLTNGSYRNHCPECLYSKHVDIAPGDRDNSCKGLMKPFMIERSGKKGWVIVHKCLKCGEIKRNKAASDDIKQPDSIDALVRLITEKIPR